MFTESSNRSKLGKKEFFTSWMVNSLNCCHGRLWRGNRWNHQVENRLGENSKKAKADAKDRDRDEPLKFLIQREHLLGE